jgi:multisubunit Na+/H+ antiporter MnhB subunit
MHPAMQGFLVGLAIALFLIVFEYLTVKKAVQERAAARHRKPEFEPTDKSRIRAVVNFCLFVPPGVAFMFWWLA